MRQSIRAYERTAKYEGYGSERQSHECILGGGSRGKVQSLYGRVWYYTFENLARKQNTHAKGQVC